MRTLSSLILLTSTLVAGQRPFFAGTRPIGFPDTPNRTTTASLDDRFGEGTTEKLPLEANGDRDLIDRISKLPIDKQPFWFINWQHLEEQRKKPQTYPQKPNVFVDPIPTNTGTSNRFSNIEPSSTGNSNSATQFTSSPLSSESNTPNSESVQSGNTTPNVQTANRFGSDLPNSNSGGSNSGFLSTYNSNTESFPSAGYSNSGSFPNAGNSNSGSFPNAGNSNTESFSNAGNSNSGSFPNAGNSNSASVPNAGNSNSGSSSNAGNSNSGFAQPNIPQSTFGSSGNRNDAQQIPNTQAQGSAVIGISDYYPQQTTYRRPGYGR